MSEELSAKKIQSLLRTESLGHKIVILDSVDSTNNYAKQHLEAHGAVVIAEEQTAGRGRLGRNWLSPKGHGLWMTIALLPGKSLESMQVITLVAGLAVAQVLDESAAGKINLQWPNDVLLNQKKVCGILTESQLRGTNASKIVVGIGLNASQKSGDFPSDLRKPATSLLIETDKKFDRNALAAAILSKFEVQYKSVISGEIAESLAQWKFWCRQLGNLVDIEQNGKSIHGKFVDIRANGAAIIVQADGSTLEVSSGEITSAT